MLGTIDSPLWHTLEPSRANCRLTHCTALAEELRTLWRTDWGGCRGWEWAWVRATTAPKKCHKVSWRQKLVWLRIGCRWEGRVDLFLFTLCAYLTLYLSQPTPMATWRMRNVLWRRRDAANCEFAVIGVIIKRSVCFSVVSAVRLSVCLNVRLSVPLSVSRSVSLLICALFTFNAYKSHAQCAHYLRQFVRLYLIIIVGIIENDAYQRPRSPHLTPSLTSNSMCIDKIAGETQGQRVRERERERQANRHD